MASVVEDVERCSRLVFVLKTVGDVFLKSLSLTSVVGRFVFGSKNEETGEEDAVEKNKMEVVQNNIGTETQNLIYLNSSLLKSEKELFKDFHNFTLKNGNPIATVLCSKRDYCRKCCGALTVEKKLWPVVIYSLDRRYIHGLSYDKSVS